MNKAWCMLCMQSYTGLTLKERRLPTMKNTTTTTRPVDANDARALLLALLNDATANEPAKRNANEPALPARFGVTARTDRPRKEEKVIVWEVRDAIARDDRDDLLTAVFEWTYCAKQPAPRTTCARFERFIDDLLTATRTGKDATCKENDAKNARFEVASSGRVKAWLYTAARGEIATVDAKPVEKPVVREFARKPATPRKKVADMTAEELKEHYAKQLAKQLAKLAK